MLKRVQRGWASKPPRILMYGVEGIGKSTFGSQAPKPIFVQTEDGLDEIDCDRFPLATTFDEVAAALSELHSEKRDYQTVVIDSLDWLERLIWDDLCRQYNVASIEKVDGPSCIAKNRYGLPDELPLSWEAFVTALSQHQNQGVKSNG